MRVRGRPRVVPLGRIIASVHRKSDAKHALAYLARRYLLGRSQPQVLRLRCRHREDPLGDASRRHNLKQDHYLFGEGQAVCPRVLHARGRSGAVGGACGRAARTHKHLAQNFRPPPSSSLDTAPRNPGCRDSRVQVVDQNGRLIEYWDQLHGPLPLAGCRPEALYDRGKQDTDLGCEYGQRDRAHRRRRRARIRSPWTRLKKTST